MIAVVGGGITGLAVGHALRRTETDVVVFEAEERPGGVIRSAEIDGRVLDWGPQRTRLTAGVSPLIHELGLDDQVVTAPDGLKLFVFRDGRLREVPFSLGAFATSDIVGLRGKLRMLLEPLTPGAEPDERVSTYFERKLGREVYETIVAPLYGGLYASDPADMEVGLSLIHVLRQFGIGRSLLWPLARRGGRIAPPPACSFRDGMQTLPDALARSLGARVRFGQPVRSLERIGDRWRLQLGDGSERHRVDVTSVVLAVPAPVAGELLSTIAPRAASVIRGLRYNPLGVVHLDAETNLTGLGFQVSFTERHRALRGVTFNHSLFGRTNLYTAYLGGALRPDVAELPEDDLARLAVKEFGETTGFDAEPLAAEQEWVPAWDVTWRGLADVSLPAGLHLGGNWWSRPGLPGRIAEAERLASALSEARPEPRSGRDT
ncbi:MAG: FAD-dependent oxidoreductase [Gemmatimonadota bacterium]|nr:FAD-dependent oxidoreductase [Gemmatimonadota bacterium]